MSDAPCQAARVTHAQLHQDIAALKVEVAWLKHTLEEMHDDVKDMRSTLSEARGSKRALVFMIGASGAAGAALTKISPWLWSLPK